MNRTNAHAPEHTSEQPGDTRANLQSVFALGIGQGALYISVAAFIFVTAGLLGSQGHNSRQAITEPILITNASLSLAQEFFLSFGSIEFPGSDCARPPVMEIARRAVFGTLAFALGLLTIVGACYAVLGLLNNGKLVGPLVAGGVLYYTHRFCLRAAGLGDN